MGDFLTAETWFSPFCAYFKKVCVSVCVCVCVCVCMPDLKNQVFSLERHIYDGWICGWLSVCVMTKTGFLVHNAHI